MARNSKVEWLETNAEKIQAAFAEFQKLEDDLEIARVALAGVKDQRNSLRGDHAKKRGIHPKAMNLVRRFEHELSLGPNEFAIFWRAFELYIDVRDLRRRIRVSVDPELFEDYVDDQTRRAAATT